MKIKYTMGENWIEEYEGTPEELAEYKNRTSTVDSDCATYTTEELIDLSAKFCTQFEGCRKRTGVVGVCWTCPIKQFIEYLTQDLQKPRSDFKQCPHLDIPCKPADCETCGVSKGTLTGKQILLKWVNDLPDNVKLIDYNFESSSRDLEVARFSIHKPRN